MKRLLACAALALLPGTALISGCAVDQTGFSSYKVETKSGEQWSVDDLKADYRNKTGNELPEPEDLRACWSDKSCYYRKWQEVYSSLINEYNQEQERIEDERKSQEIARAAKICAKDPACRQRKTENDLTERLRRGYETTLNSFSESYAEGDLLFRRVCAQSAAAQRRGVSRSSLEDIAQDAPGISPYYRPLLSEISTACWDSAKIKFDWQKAIRTSQF